MSPKHLLIFKVPQETLSPNLKKKKPTFSKFLCLVIHYSFILEVFALEVTLTVLFIFPVYLRNVIYLV